MRRFPVQAPFNGPSGEIMKTGNAPLRNGDFRRVAYRRKTAQALRQQASGHFLVAAFREQARRFGTERPRPQMLVELSIARWISSSRSSPRTGGSPACS